MQRKDPRPVMRAELHLYGRLAKTHVHYDRTIICEDGKEFIQPSRCYGGYGGLYPSFDIDTAKDYIRDAHGGYLKEYFVEDLDLDHLKNDVDRYSILQFKLEFTAVKFYDSPFVCPNSGITWQPYSYDSTEHNSHYALKKLPKQRKKFIVCERERDVYDYISRS